MVRADETVEVGGVTLRMRRTGSGSPVLFLHGEDGTIYTDAFIERLSDRHEVLVPSHPGWGESVRPAHVESIADLAYIYLDLLAGLDAGPVPVVGVSFGGWLAAEIAVRCSHDLSALVLAAPLGIKLGDRTERDYVDLYASDADTVRAALYADPDAATPLSDLDDDQFRSLARAQEAMARYAWEPYLHTANLPHRLHRVGVPTLVVSGSEDRFVLRDDLYDRYAELIGDGAQRTVVEGAGHRIEEEAPDELAQVVTKFLDNI